jgi:hypothetical protein
VVRFSSLAGDALRYGGSGRVEALGRSRHGRRKEPMMDRFSIATRAISALPDATRWALAALVMVSLSATATAQAQADRNVVAWKGTFLEGGSSTSFLLPVDPPIMVVTYTAKGNDSVLGSVTDTGYYLLRLGFDGTPLAVTNGVYTSIGANGDAIRGTFSGLVRPSEKPGFVISETVGFVTGGAGRFAGATGHDRSRIEVELATGKQAGGWEGVLTMPKQ